jgi:DNA-binding winged helix-turn-helix (wHTH) protein
MISTLTREQNEILDLRDRVYDLEQENAKLRREMRSLNGGTFPREWRLQPAHSAILHRLCASRSGFVEHSILLRAVADRTGHSPGLDTLRVHVYHMRRSLRPFGIRIFKRHGEGYELPATSRAIIEAAMGSPR